MIHYTLKFNALRRIKLAATALLVSCGLLFILARTLEPKLPAFGWLGAFAEAAMIGGLADWYALVALFKRPLGLPIPHTAIIAENQERIADSLATFIEVNFLAPKPVGQELREVDFAALAGAISPGRCEGGSLRRRREAICAPRRNPLAGKPKASILSRRAIGGHLTEPDVGSGAAGGLTRPRRKWRSGIAAEKIENKIAVRVVQNAVITLTDCRVAEADPTRLD